MVSPGHQIRLNTAVSVAFAAAFVLSLLVTGVWTWQHVDRDAHVEHAAQMKQTTEYFATSVAMPFWQFDESSIKFLLDAGKKLEGVKRIRLVDSKGTTKYEVMNSDSRDELQKYIFASEPIRIPDNVGQVKDIGSVQFTYYPPNLLQKELRSFVVLMATQGVLLFMCGLIVFFALRRVVVAPISRMKERAARLSEVESSALTYESVPEQIVEFEELRAQFNHASSQINDLVKKLRESNTSLLDLNMDLERQVEERAAARTRFLATVSHEIRTPLNGIIGASDVLDGTTLNQDQMETLSIIKSSASALRTIVDEILEFTVGRRDGAEVTIKEVSVQRVVTEIFNRLDNSKPNRGVTGRLVVDQKIPMSVLSDEGHIRRIVLNILGNAFKFTQRGSVSFVVLWHQDDKGDSLEFSVTDTGIGMSEDFAKKVGAPFSQEDQSITRVYGGVGIGLATVRQLVSHLRGELQIDSKKGVGTKISVIIPVNRNNETGHSQKGLGKLPVPGAVTTKGMRVLVAEDNEVNIKVIVKLLERLGCDIEVARNGREVLEIIQGDPSFTVILMDIQMPVMDGITAAREIYLDRMINPKPLIYAVTANVASDIERQIKASGMQGVIEKPISLAALSALFAEINGKKAS